MKRALLLHAKLRFNEMKSRHSSGSTLTTQLAAPISPTPDLIIEAFLPRLDLTPESFLVDLGCGDGRWLIAANEQTRCQCLGIDVDAERLKMAEESIIEKGLRGRVRVRRQDVFEFVKEGDELREADAIVVYLFRDAMLTIGDLLRRRLSVGDNNGNATPKSVQILSVGFALPGWSPTYKERVNGICVYLYSTKDQSHGK